MKLLHKMAKVPHTWKDQLFTGLQCWIVTMGDELDLRAKGGYGV